MEELVNKIIECDFEHLNFNEFPLNEKFGLIVWKRNVKYEFLLNLKENSKNLICIGSGALNPPDKKYSNKSQDSTDTAGNSANQHYFTMTLQDI